MCIFFELKPILKLSISIMARQIPDKISRTQDNTTFDKNDKKRWLTWNSFARIYLLSRFISHSDEIQVLRYWLLIWLMQTYLGILATVDLKLNKSPVLLEETVCGSVLFARRYCFILGSDDDLFWWIDKNFPIDFHVKKSLRTYRIPTPVRSEC